MVTTNTTARSAGVTPRMLPNRAASKLVVKLRVLLMSATPSAKLAVVMMPMAASAPILPTTRHGIDEQRRRESPGAGAEVEVDAGHVGHDRAAEHRVRQAMADVAHVAQHHVDADEAAQQPTSTDTARPWRKKA